MFLKKSVCHSLSDRILGARTQYYYKLNVNTRGKSLLLFGVIINLDVVDNGLVFEVGIP